MLSDSRQDNKSFCTKWEETLPKFNLLFISIWTQLWFLHITPVWNYFMWTSVSRYTTHVVRKSQTHTMHSPAR